MAKKDYDEGWKDWAGKARLDHKKAGSRDYRKGAQDARTRQVDDELRSLEKGGSR